MSAHDSQDTMSPGVGIRPPANRVAAPQGLQRAGTGINFDNPSVQKALDTLIQSGPTINQLVNSGSLTGRSGQGVSQNQGLSQGHGQNMSQGYGQGVGQGVSQGLGQGLSHGMRQGMNQGMAHGMGQGAHYQHHY